MSRKTARNHIVNILFQKDFNPEISWEEIVSTYREELKEIEEGDMAFVMEEVRGIAEHEEELIEAIEGYASGWSRNRISKVDMAILKLGTYEVLYREDIPDKVAANEAVELAKSISGDKAPGFINGILGSVISGKEKV